MNPLLTRPAAAKLFNTTDDGNKIDTRSPRRGPQPLGVAVGHVAGRTYAFVGLRKEGGIIVADITNAAAGVTMDWYSTRDYTLQPNKDPNNPTGKLDTHKLVDCELHSEDGMAPADRSDLGPEGVLFIPGLLSPDRNHPLLVVNYDQSGSTRIYQIDRVSQRSPAQLR